MPHRLVPHKELEPFYRGVDEFCESLLPLPLHETSPSLKRKLIADPVEGYSSLASWEVAIVDSPLFQRLRDIRQLGMARLVYPTLGYSRFEHIIGVRSRLEQVLTTLRENMAQRQDLSKDLPTPRQLVRIRLAALCHDIGHCILSHVSESVIGGLPGSGKRYPSSTAIEAAFERFAGKRIPISEILSVAILTSPRFAEYLRLSGLPAGDGRLADVRSATMDAAHFILGIPLPGDPSSLFLAQLMNGGFDIDKLDYMFRESLLSGISLGVAPQWLMKRLILVELPHERVPSGLKNRLKGFSRSDTFTVLGLEREGQFAFEEFCIARLTLHEKIYLHQKVRAAEAQVRAVLQRVADQEPAYRRAHQWLYLKEALFDYPDAPLPGVRQKGKVPTGEDRFGLHTLSRRRLLTRAFAFGWQNSIGDPVRKEKSELGIDRLSQLARKDPARLVRAIREHLEVVLEAAGIDGKKGRLASEMEILVDPPRISNIQQGQDSIYIEYPPRLSRRWTMPIDQIEQYYQNNRALGYIFSDRRYLSVVLLAAEKAAYALCGAICVQEGLINNDVLEASRKLRMRLSRQGFYDNAPVLRPVSDYLNTPAAQALVGFVAERLSIYETSSHSRVSSASVTAFIAQFPQHLQPVALSWIQHVEMVRPEEALRRLIAAEIVPAARKRRGTIGLSPLRPASDVAVQMASSFRNIAESVPKGWNTFHVPLSDALELGLDYYIIYDDALHHASTVFQAIEAWLKADARRSLLLEMNVVFAFAIETEGALGDLEQQLVECLGFDAMRVRCVADRSLLSEDRILSGVHSPFQHPKKRALHAFLRKVARAGGHDGEGEAMIVFPYSSPDMTSVPLRCAMANGRVAWTPLADGN